MSKNKEIKDILGIEDLSNIISVKIPDSDKILEVDVSSILIINGDLPADVTDKLGKCAGFYAQFGSLRADAISYKEMLEDEFEEFEKKKMAIVREKLSGKPSESRIKEEVYVKESEKIMMMKKKMRLARKNEEKLKRICRALEIQAESLRTLSANLRKESDISKMDDSIPDGKGNLKNITKKGGRKDG